MTVQKDHLPHFGAVELVGEVFAVVVVVAQPYLWDAQAVCALELIGRTVGVNTC